MKTRLHLAWRQLALVGFACLVLSQAAIGAVTNATELQVQYEKQAGRTSDAKRGERLFNLQQTNELSCASCHGNPPTQASKHASTGKSIAALAPRVNPDRFTDSIKVEKWFRRNCKDVFNRECNAAEKADILAFVKSFE